MRKTPVFLAVTALAAVGLVGCSSNADASCQMPSPSAALSSVEVSGSMETNPRVELRAPFHIGETSAETVEAGDGPAFTSDAQTALLDLQVISGETGEPLVSTRYSGDAATTPSLAQLATSFPGLTDALHCATEGSRVVVGMAPEGIEPAAAPSLGLAEGESAVLVADLRKVFLASADGADQFNESHGLPTVVRAPDGRPGIIVPEATPPADLVVQTLKRGDGAEVAAGDVPVLQYTSVDWDSPRTVTQTTWDAEAAPVALDSLPAGVAEGIEGQTVGSQVLIVAPDEASGRTLVYVVDVLGIV